MRHRLSVRESPKIGVFETDSYNLSQIHHIVAFTFT